MAEPIEGFSFDDTSSSDLILPSQLVGPLGSWAYEKMSIGEIVVPRHLFIIQRASGEPHNVAWMYRQEAGADLPGVHYAVCDCIGEAEARADLDIMFSCSALATAVIRRAHQVRGDHDLQQVIEAPNPDQEYYDSGIDPKVIRGILYLLRKDREDPTAWPGNIANGSHEIVLMSQVLNRSIEEVQDCAGLLEEVGAIELKGDDQTSVALAA
jgi:hypothetical protein